MCGMAWCVHVHVGEWPCVLFMVLQLKSCFKGSPLLSSFPEMPKRGMKLFQDHTKPEFVDGRRRALAQYLSLLCAIPRMTSLGDFCLFLGISEGVYERSVIIQVPTRCM